MVACYTIARDVTFSVAFFIDLHRSVHSLDQFMHSIRSGAAPNADSLVLVAGSVLSAEMACHERSVTKFFYLASIPLVPEKSLFGLRCDTSA